MVVVPLLFASAGFCGQHMLACEFLLLIYTGLYSWEAWCVDALI
jgi:hypothetical protein